MSVIPTTQEGVLEYFADHAPVWEAQALAIGITASQATALNNAVESFKAARTARSVLKQQAKAATTTVDQTYNELRTIGAGLLAIIRAYAETTNNPAVYAIAEVAPPKPPTPAPPPENPTMFTADPAANGTIDLKWKGSAAQNGSFDIERSIDGGPYVLLTNKRTKKWTDVAVPMNTNMIVYRIFGVRDDVRSSPGTTAQVLFGTLPAAIQAAFRTGGAVTEAA